MNVQIRAWKKGAVQQLTIAANNMSNMLRDGFPYPYTQKMPKNGY